MLNIEVSVFFVSNRQGRAHLQIYVFDLKTCLNYKEEQVASTMLRLVCGVDFYRRSCLAMARRLSSCIFEGILALAPICNRCLPCEIKKKYFTGLLLIKKY